MTKTCVWPLGTGPRPSEAHERRSTITAGLAHSAPRGRSGNLMGRIGSLSGTNEVKEICFPSGDHLMPFGACCRWVSCAFSRVSSHSTCNCFVPSRSERKATRLPSGDQAGEESLRAPDVNSRTREPSTSTIQRLLRYWSLTLSTQVRVKMICLPSGEISGLPTDSMSIKVSLSSRRGFGWATAAAQRKNRTVTMNRRRVFIVASIQIRDFLWKCVWKKRGYFRRPELVRFGGLISKLARIADCAGIRGAYRRLHQCLCFFSFSFVFAEHDGGGHPAPG